MISFMNKHPFQITFIHNDFMEKQCAWQGVKLYKNGMQESGDLYNGYKSLEMHYKK